MATSASIPARSCAARRPHSKASLLAGIATPLSSIARSIAARLIGTRPRCQAAPSMNILAAIGSPSRSLARRCASSTKAPSPSASFRPADQRLGVDAPVRIARELFGRRHVGGDDRACAGFQLGQGFVARGDDEVAADQRVRFAGGDASRMQRPRVAREANMRGDGAVFLAHAGEVEVRAVEAVEIGGDRKRLADGDDAGPTDAGDQHIVERADLGKSSARVPAAARAARPARACADFPRAPSRSSGRTPRRRCNPCCSSTG